MDLLTKPVNIKALVDALEFSGEDVEGAALRQPKLFLEAARYRVLKMKRRAAAQLQADVLEAEFAQERRNKKSKDGKKSQTEGSIREAVTLEPAMQTARKELDDAFASEEFAKLLLTAYQHRQGVLKVIAEIRNAEIAHELRSVRENMSTAEYRKKAGEVRRKYESMEEEE